MCNICDKVLRIIVSLCISLCISLNISGCTYQGVPGDWIGASFPELEAGFGAPEAVLINERNNRVYVFRESPLEPGAATKMTFGDGEIVMPDAQCAILFELSEDIVTRWSWFEAGCQEFSLPKRPPQR